MERNIVMFSIPNLITVPVMAFGGFLVLALVWQLAGRALDGRGGASSADGSY